MISKTGNKIELEFVSSSSCQKGMNHEQFALSRVKTSLSSHIYPTKWAAKVNLLISENEAKT